MSIAFLALGISGLLIVMLTWSLLKLTHIYNSYVLKLQYSQRPHMYTELVNDGYDGVFLTLCCSCFGGVFATFSIAFLGFSNIVVLSSVTCLITSSVFGYQIYTHRGKGFAVIYSIRKILMPYIITSSVLVTFVFICLCINGYVGCKLCRELSLLDVAPLGLKSYN